MSKCKRCKEWNEQRNYIYKEFTKIGMEVEAEGLDNDCVCHLMDNRKPWNVGEMILDIDILP